MSIFGKAYFLQFVVPLIAVGASVFLKFVTRNDAHKSFRKEDLAVGLDLSVTALIIFITASSQMATALAANPSDTALQSKLAGVPWVIAFFTVGIWGVSTLVRKTGWAGEDKLKPFWGIAAPDIFGIGSLLLVVNWIS
ncbi:MAG: hypothetical protein H7A47_17085 [Verrucomicrobiales bacterium]|nr:hypothetical protein [Verrucomicrobiales bacterium]